MVVVCVRACVRGGGRGVRVSAHTVFVYKKIETSQSNRACVITSNAEIMSNDHQHCRRTRARTHGHSAFFHSSTLTWARWCKSVSVPALFCVCQTQE